ncbi:MAG: polysaccharide deacetylase family protein [Anaerolineae bacterium]|nr:polysaccharide deacetylase family protein [Anaerolineae bacterium]MCI0609313.1 polysaccharide deacetylase family protein [Anaerolineae bacterium]
MSRIDSLLRIAAPFVRPIYGGAGVILMFHRVLPRETHTRIRGHANLEITPEALEQTIHYFARRNYDVYSPDDLYRFLTGVKKEDKPFVQFTFDDGYVDNLIYAYPIFKKHNIPFTINVSTCFPDHTAVIWWYLLEDLILNRERLTFEHAGQTYDFDCTAQEGKAKAFAITRKLFKFANIQERGLLTNSVLLANDMDLLRKIDEVALRWDQLKQLASDPLVTLSAHTVNHYVLSSLRDEEVQYEILESKRILESNLDKQIDHFAYPFGNRREAEAREFRIATECGFKTAMTTRTGGIFSAHGSHLMTLPRYDLAQLTLPRDLNLVTSGASSLRVNRFKRVITA